MLKENLKLLLLRKGLTEEETDNVLFVVYSSKMDKAGNLTPTREFTQEEQRKYDLGKGLANFLTRSMVADGF